jgi:hypothetical protein
MSEPRQNARVTKPGCTVAVPKDLIETDPDRITWAVVSTIKAPLRDVLRFAAYYLDLGAQHLYLYLDEPDAGTVRILGRHDQISLIQCDDAYWTDKPKKARETHQLRQAFNATRCYGRCDQMWVAHFDVDEFLLPTQPLHHELAAVPANAAYVRVQPAELLAQPDPYSGPAHFKLTGKAADQTKTALARIYPQFGAYLPEGFISYTGGKNIARTGLSDIRLGIHGILRNGQRIENGYMLPNSFLGHAHAPDWDTFLSHLHFRMTYGSYRKSKNNNKHLSNILEVLLNEGGHDALRLFFDEVCTASPHLLSELAAHDMLITRSLDLDEKVRRWFGDVHEQTREST